MKENNLQPRLLYSARISFNYEEKNQKLYRQAKAERIQHHQISSPTNAKGSSLDRKHNKVNGNGIILSIITLNINGLNAPTERQRLAE